jgi:putative ABC transport system permease protein
VSKVFKRLGLIVSDLLLSLLKLAAWVLSPLRLGRLLSTISIPRMREHRARSSMTVLGVALGVAVLVAVKIVSDSVMSGVSATVDNIAGKADLQLSTASSGFDEALLDRIHTVPGVYKATPVVQQPATLLSHGARGDRLLVLGVDLLGTEDAYFRDYASSELTAIRKDSLEFLNSTSNILIGKKVAERFNLKLHDKISLLTDTGAQAF